MYNDYFGFSESPFENNLDQRFHFFSSHQKEVASALLNFITLQKGFALVCGDAGTGKTMLINYLLSRLPDTVHPIMIASPNVSYMQIVQNIVGILEIDTNGKSELDLIDQVITTLKENRRQAERFVLIVDDAHLFSYQHIEQIRLLSNIETHKRKLFQILLIGQCALSHRLNRFEMRQVCQRININRFLTPMDTVETIQYINHRLEIVGSSFDDCFKSNCKHLIFKMTKGVPRSINQLCDSALLTCVTEKRHRVNRKVLKIAGTDLRSQMSLAPWTQAVSKTFSLKTIQLSAAFGTAAIMSIFLGIYGYQGGLSERVGRFLQGVYPSTQTFPASEARHVSEAADTLNVQPATTKPGSRNAAKLMDGVGKTSVIARFNADMSDSGAFIHAENQQTLPKADAEFEQKSIFNFTEIQIQSIGAAHSFEIQYEQSGSGELFSEMNLIAEPPASQEEKIYSIKISPLFYAKDVNPKLQTVASHVPQKIVVNNGDTMFGIASRFYPENPIDGVKKIHAANPLIHDISRIHPGQKLIIP